MLALVIVSAALSLIGSVLVFVRTTKGGTCAEGVHKFQAVFDRQESAPSVVPRSMSGMDASEMIGVLDATKSRTSTYVGHTCTRCGTVVKRDIP